MNGGRRGGVRREAQTQGDDPQKGRDTGQGSQPPIEEGRPTRRGFPLLGRFGRDRLQASMHAHGEIGGYDRRIVSLTEQASDVFIPGSPVRAIHGSILVFTTIPCRSCTTVSKR